MNRSTDQCLPGLAPPPNTIEVRSADLAAAIERLKAEGARVESMDVHGATYVLHVWHPTPGRVTSQTSEQQLDIGRYQDQRREPTATPEAERQQGQGRPESHAP